MKRYRKILGAIMASALLLTGCGTATEDANTSGNDVNVEAGNTETGNGEGTQASGTDSGSVSIFDTMDVSDMQVDSMTFDATTRYQTIDGFGGAFTWYGDRLAKAKNSEGGYDAFFTDAKMTILRFKNEYNYTIEGKASNATAMVTNYKEARNRAAQYGEKVTVLMSCWSPPAYLKSDNTISNGYGTLKKNDKGEYMYEEYADWWVESLQYYMDKGVVIDYVSIQNEVDFSPESYEGCRFAPKENENVAGYDEAFIAVYDAMQEAFGEDAPILLGPETMSCSIGDMISYATPILEKRPESLGGLAYHLYVGGTSDETNNTVNVRSYYSNFTGLESYYPDTKKWETEFWVGQGLETAELIWSALVNAEMNAYIYWSAIWADSTPDRFDSADLMEINNSGQWRLAAKYYALRHYSEYIRPGYQRIGAESADGWLKFSSFANDENTKVAVVLVNSSAYDVAYHVSGTDYTITDSAVYQSVYGDGAGEEANMYKALGSIGKDGLVVVPAYSVTTIDITGYYGDTAVEYVAPAPITYEDDVAEAEAAAPTEDVTILSSNFAEKSQINSYSAFGSSSLNHVADGGSDGKGCMEVRGRGSAWNGMALSEGYFEKYGYLVKISYDCMMDEGGQTLSCTSTFSANGSTYYPDGENNRVACYDMEAGKWYHCEGYVTLYSNMDQESFRVYWESPDNTYDFYLDNIEVTILYSQPVGEYVAQ